MLKKMYSYLFTQRQASHDLNILLDEIKYTRLALESATSKFHNVVDPELIDSYIFEIKAAQIKYNYLLHKLKLVHKKTGAS